MSRSLTRSRYLAFGLFVLLSLACQVSGLTPEVLSTASVSEPSEVVVTPLPTQPPPSPTFSTAEPAQQTSAPDLVSQQERLVAIYENVSPGVVSIRTGDGQGSGFVVDMDGHIVTNFHVVQEADNIEVNFPSGFKAFGELIGSDLDSDLAVIKVDAPNDSLYPLALGDSSTAKVGQTVIAIGNPFGLKGTMTVGIVSALGRTLESLRVAPDSDQFFSAGDIIQTDAAINPGNSGGPLLNLNGDVIGVNRAIRTENFDVTGNPLNTGIGFAIPVNIVKRVVPFLISQGFYRYPYLGISSLNEITLSFQVDHNLPRATGSYVSDVTPGGPSDQAGLQAGDLIVAVDERDVLTFGDLLSYLIIEKSPGEMIVLTVLRGGDEFDLNVQLGERP